MTNRQSAALTILDDCAARAQEIAAITHRAFLERYGSGDGEVALIAGLRAEGDVIVELARVQDGEVVGHAMFSRMIADPALCRAAALAPVAVRIDRQQLGIGGALIRTGLQACAEKGMEAVFVLGDPTYYRRFGFSAVKADGIASAYSGPHFQALELRAGALDGVKSVAYARAFAAV
jgi:putative acetyltransferase